MFLFTPILWVLLDLVLSSTIAQRDGATVAEVKPSVAFACLESVPVDVKRDVALIDYLLPYAQFQSTLGYLKAPPKEYLLPGVDVLGGLVQIREKLRDGGYISQFEFTKDLSRVYSAAHDAHFNYAPALHTVFDLARTLWPASVSVNGTDLPKVYVQEDILLQPNSSNISPIEFIDDIPIDDFLAVEAHNKHLHDPDAQYNYVFWFSAARSKTPDKFVPGSYLVNYPDSHTVRFVNGSSREFPNKALIQIDFDEIDSGEKLHKKYVEVPDGPDPKAAFTADPAITPEEGSPMPNSRYPSNPVASHKYGGYISGYLLEDDHHNDTCVLAVFTFLTAHAAFPGYNLTKDFTEARRTIRETLSSCKVDGRTRLIVDVSGNDGGYAALVSELYRNLFPKAKEWTGNRIRAHPAVDLLGRLLYNNTELPHRPPVSASDLDPKTGSPYKTWTDLYGPAAVNVMGNNNDEDEVLETNMLADNQSAPVDSDSFYLTGAAPKWKEEVLPEQPFDASNIVVLTNGVCFSACAFFTGLMAREQGVRTIAVGGRPLYTPMQAIGGTKGGQMITGATIRSWFDLILNRDRGNVRITSRELAALVPSPDLAPLEPVTLQGSTVNYRNQYVEGYELTEEKRDDYPPQFMYEAANCRLFYKAEHWKTVAALWRDVSDVAWRNASCVPNSTTQRDGDRWIISDKTQEYSDKVRSSVLVYDGPGSLTNNEWHKYGKLNTTGLGIGHKLREEEYEVPGDFWDRMKRDEEEEKHGGQRHGEHEQEGKKDEKSSAEKMTPGITRAAVTGSLVVAVGLLMM
ncbi:hypothetical protein B0T20DRAFT_508139 [Sordaria brevicollis]|uniref:CPAF-like PDZ domain-containing protein n=1 Tax=Sordaria brevicollis TaxID=83679 RepID=A0AAE0UAT9_SORBR|nr:hypothetical protein B0T20DRAFT_508139 [Sordaria brevicollis]